MTLSEAADNSLSWSTSPKNGSTYHMSRTSVASATTTDTAGIAAGDNTLGKANLTLAGITATGYFKKSRSTNWSTDWRNSSSKITQGEVDALCSDDGFSWPHRTLGWKMLKDDLFGLDFDNNRWVGVGETRSGGTGNERVAHDLDSVCLDCHNPTIWNDGQVQTADGHVDKPGAANTKDNHNDELLTRGLP